MTFCIYLRRRILRFSRISSWWGLHVGTCWSSSYGIWIYSYMYNQCIAPLKMWVNGEVYSVQHYVIKFISNLRLVGGFLLLLWFPPPIRRSATI